MFGKHGVCGVVFSKEAAFVVFAMLKRGSFGTHGADVPGAAISSPWVFPPKALATFFGFVGKGENRAEACSGNNVAVPDFP